MDPTGMARRLVGCPGNEQKRFAKRTCHGRKNAGTFIWGLHFENWSSCLSFHGVEGM